MPRVLHISTFGPQAVGNGGHHRTYQVFFDLRCAAGDEQVRHVDYLVFYGALRRAKQQAQARSLLRRLLRPLETRLIELRHRLENPFRLFSRTTFSPGMYSPPQFVEHYAHLVNEFRPDMCVIEHPGFGGIAEFNRRHGIVTIACQQNLESLDTGWMLATHRRHLLKPDSRWHNRSRTFDLSNELNVLDLCDYRLFISRVEAGFVQGFGLPSQFYPYLPVGEIAANLRQIRERRRAKPPERGLFLLLGSANHPPTQEAHRWLLEQIEGHGLPAGVRLIVAGKNAEQLLPSGAALPGVEIHGWVEQSQLDDWLARVQGVLVPRHKGFGALTRLAELPCAGIPAVASRYATLAVDLPPNVWPVDDTWPAWADAMRRLMDAPPPDLDAYDAWERAQGSVLREIVRGG